MGGESKRHLYIAGGVVGASMAAHFFFKVRTSRRVLHLKRPSSVEPYVPCARNE